MPTVTNHKTVHTSKKGFDLSLKLLLGLVFLPFILMYWIFKIVKYVSER